MRWVLVNRARLSSVGSGGLGHLAPGACSLSAADRRRPIGRRRPCGPSRWRAVDAFPSWPAAHPATHRLRTGSAFRFFGCDPPSTAGPSGWFRGHPVAGKGAGFKSGGRGVQTKAFRQGQGWRRKGRRTGASLYERTLLNVSSPAGARHRASGQAWGRAKAGLHLPKNAATGRLCSGINILILWGTVFERSSACQNWLKGRWQ